MSKQARMERLRNLHAVIEVAIARLAAQPDEAAEADEDCIPATTKQHCETLDPWFPEYWLLECWKRACPDS